MQTLQVGKTKRFFLVETRVSTRKKRISLLSLIL